MPGQRSVCCEQHCTQSTECASGYCSSAGVCDLPPLSGSPHAKGFAAVLTRYRRGVFVVGGDDPGNKQPTGEIWFAPLGADKWQPVVTPGYTVEHVLAATYSFASDRLYVLDEKQGKARLTAIDPIARTAESLGAWPRHSGWDREYLLVDRDGGLLVASSQSAGKISARAEARNPTCSTSGRAVFSAGEQAPRIGRDTRPPPHRRLMGGAQPR